jgi:hypothetical protein
MLYIQVMSTVIYIFGCIGGNTNLYFFKWNTQYFFAFLESFRQNKKEDTTFDGSNFYF